MIALGLSEVAALCGGTAHHDAGTTVRGAATVDSRTVEPGGLLVALAGERVDGHDFAAAAHDAGAAAVLGSRPVDGPCVVVDDVVAALGVVGRTVLERVPERTVVGITGSQGKTSTKDLLAQVLETRGATVATRGNHNNELGVPLTLTRADEATRHLVVEMGARAVGNIAYLCTLAPPDVAVVLNVGTAHLGEFGSREAIARTKGELVEALRPDGVAVLSADDPVVAGMRTRTVGRVLTFGRDAAADVRVEDLRVDDDGCPTFTLVHDGERAAVALPLLGEHQADNAAAAAAAALAVGVPLAEVASVLGRAEARSAWRMERSTRDDGLVVVNDAYNANPASAASALRTVAALAERRGGRGWAVLGEMAELGPDGDRDHQDLGRLAAGLGLHVLAVGAGSGGIADGARAAAGTATVERVGDPDAAVAWLADRAGPSDVVLLKASRVVGLERAATGLLTSDGHTVADAHAAGPRIGRDRGVGG